MRTVPPRRSVDGGDRPALGSPTPTRPARGRRAPCRRRGRAGRAVAPAPRRRRTSLPPPRCARAARRSSASPLGTWSNRSDDASSSRPKAATNSSNVPRSAGCPLIVTRSPFAVCDDEVVAGSEAADPARVDVAVVELVVEVLVDVEHRLGHRDVDPAADAGLLATVQRGEDRRRRLERGVHVGVAERVVGVGAAAGVALRLGDPRLGADDRCVGAPIRPRPARPVAGDRCVHEARLAGAQRHMIESEAVHHAGAVVLDDDIAVLGELGGDGRPGGGRQVDADVALAGVLLDEVGGQAVDLRRGEAGQVAGREARP